MTGPELTAEAARLQSTKPSMVPSLALLFGGAAAGAAGATALALGIIRGNPSVESSGPQLILVGVLASVAAGFLVTWGSQLLARAVEHRHQIDNQVEDALRHREKLQ